MPPQVDATKLSGAFDCHSFDVAIDKGTLDAIMSASGAKGVQVAYKMFGELLRYGILVVVWLECAFGSLLCTMCCLLQCSSPGGPILAGDIVW